MTLEQLIADAVARGELCHLSVSATQNGKSFRACFTPASVYGNSFAEAADPVTAIRNAMTGVKLRRRPVSKPKEDAADLDFG